MADTNVSGGGVDVAALLKSIQTQTTPQPNSSTSIKMQAGANLDAISSAVSSMSNAIKGQQVVQASTLQAQKSISDVQAGLSANASTQMTDISTAQSRVTTAEGADATLAQNRNQALFERSGLDATDTQSTLSSSIDDFKLAHDRAKNLIETAEYKDGLSLGDVFRGTHSFAEYFDAKVLNTPDEYIARAKTQLQLAGNAADTITGLQSMYTGEAQINASLHPNLTAGVIADKAAVASAAFAKQAADYQIDSLTRQSKYLDSVLSNSQFRASNAPAVAKVNIEAENATRMFMVASQKTQTPEIKSNYIRIALKAMGVAGADNWTAQFVKEIENNPVMKSRADELALQGMTYAGAANTPNAPLPAGIYGTPGQAVANFILNKGHMPAGSEGVEKLLYKAAAGTDIDPITRKVYTPAQKVAAIDANMDTEIAAIARDLDSTISHGKPPIKAIAASPMFATPVMAPMKVILAALAAKNDSVPIAMVDDAVNALDIPNSVKVQMMLNYGNLAAGTVDARGKHQIVGVPTASALGYTGYANTGSLFNSVESIKWTDEKSITDHVFKRGIIKSNVFDRQTNGMLGIMGQGDK